jgi:hypothetical protein
MAAERDHDADLRPRDQLIAELRSLCAATRSGTLFIITLENHPAQVVLRDGEIVGVSYRLTRGPEALAPLSVFSAARYRFQRESVPVADPRLPPTADILARLSAESRPAEGPQPASTSDASPRADARPTADARSPGDMGSGPEVGLESETVGRLRPLIERELAEFLGPMAAVICDEHLARLTELGPPEVANLVDAIAREIEDPAKKAQFTQRVLSQLDRG